MKKLLTFCMVFSFVLLASSNLAFSQERSVKPTTTQSIDKNALHSTSPYPPKEISSDKRTISVDEYKSLSEEQRREIKENPDKYEVSDSPKLTTKKSSASNNYKYKVAEDGTLITTQEAFDALPAEKQAHYKANPDKIVIQPSKKDFIISEINTDAPEKKSKNVEGNGVKEGAKYAPADINARTVANEAENSTKYQQRMKMLKSNEGGTK